MIKTLFFSFILISIFQNGLSMCPNLCNANGICCSDNLCKCFPGYIGPECNLRTCPYGYAWADKAYSQYLGHQYAECSAAGMCNENTGVCECFDGFTGQACEKALCPNLCNNRGTCMTMADMASFYGQDYDPSVWSAGDGYGPTYANWDKDAITLCNCDYGYFGPDCSQVMCPKGDDPVTDSQNYRQILLTVKDYDPFSGVLGVSFQGETTFISLASPSSSDCETAFEASDKFDDVTCTYTVLLNSEISFDITFISWPKLPQENNLFSPHGGNPSTADFTCDISRTDPNTVCTFTDVVNTQLREYEYCSNRGTCNFKTGECTCIDGFGGIACERINHIFSHTTDTGVAEQITVRSPDYISTAYSINVARSSDPDFYLLETFSDSKQSFYVRGDGEVGALKAKVWNRGMTVDEGGLTVENGGLAVATDGAYFFNSDVTSPVLSVHSTSEAFTGDTLKITTTATKTASHNLVKAYSSSTAKFSVRGDGLVNVGDVGMLVTGGLSVRNDGLLVSDGMTVYDSGLELTSGMTIVGAATVTGGLTVATAGLKVLGGVSVFARVMVETGGVLVTAGGQTISAGGMAVVDGITIAQAGLTVTGSLSIHSSGFKVTGGVSINNLGLTITEGLTVESVGIKVDSGGMSISDGVKITDGLSVHDTGVTIYDGATVVDTGLVVELGGLSVDSLGLFVTDGLTVNNGGLNVLTGGAGIIGGVSIDSAGIKVVAGVTVESNGLVVTVGGLSVNAGGMSARDGMTVETGGLTVDAIGMQVDTGLTLHDVVGLKVDGGLTIENYGLMVTADGVTVRLDGMTIEDGLTVVSGGVRVEAGGLETTDGLTLNDAGVKVTGGITVMNTGLVVSADGATIMGNGLKVENGITLSNTGLTVTTSGMGVTGGLTVNDVGLKVAGGVTVESGGSFVTAGGSSVVADSMQVGGGITLLSGALKVDANGIKTTGGLSINNGGLVVPSGMGMTVVDAGVVVLLNGFTVTSGGLKAAGGVTVESNGLFVESGGVKATGGLSVNGGGVTFYNGASLTVVDTGLVVSAGGATISGGVKVATGMTVSSGNFIAGSHVQSLGGMSIYGGAKVSPGLTVEDTGMKVDTGGATFSGNLRIFNSMTVTGTVFCNSYTPPSDRRLKTKITPLKNSLSDITKLRGVYFKWDEKSPHYDVVTNNGTASGRQLGLIAQDVEVVYPELIHKILEGEYKGLNYLSLVPVLIEAVRELNDKYVDLDIFSLELDESTKSCRG